LVGGVPLERRCSSCHDGSLDAPAGRLALDRARQADGRLRSYSGLMGDDFVQFLNDDGELTSLFSALDPDAALLLEKIDGQYWYLFAGALREILAEEYLVDANGDPILDADGDQIPLFFHILESAVFDTRRLVRTRALDNHLFESVFRTGVGLPLNTLSYDHQDPTLFSDAELRLLWEWIDLGWQYSNDPLSFGVGDP
jgi:hypothetical protein